MNPLSQTQQSKRKLPSFGNDNVLESLRTVGTSIGKTVMKDVVAQAGTDVITSIFGGMPQNGELKQNQTIEFNQPKEMVQRSRPVEIMRPTSGSDEREVAQKIDAIRSELKALSQSIKNLRQEISKTIIDAPVNPGIYHLNFLEHLQSYLRTLKQDIDDSRTWLAASNTRKAKKGYWGQYKKQGTTFGLSHERSAATSSG